MKDARGIFSFICKDLNIDNMYFLIIYRLLFATLAIMCLLLSVNRFPEPFPAIPAHRTALDLRR